MSGTPENLSLLSAVKLPLRSVLTHMVSGQRAAVILDSSMSPPPPIRLGLSSLVSCSLDMMHLSVVWVGWLVISMGVFFLVFILVGVFGGSWTCVLSSVRIFRSSGPR